MNKLYTSKDCATCHTVKKYLKQRAVEYEEIDRDIGENAQEMLKIAGVVTTPVFVNDKGVAIGMNLPKLAKLL